MPLSGFILLLTSWYVFMILIKFVFIGLTSRTGDNYFLFLFKDFYSLCSKFFSVFSLKIEYIEVIRFLGKIYGLFLGSYLSSYFDRSYCVFLF